MRRLPALLLLTLGACSPNGEDAPDVRRDAASDASIGNLRAFAKLYGYVRYFHPSDAAAALDWDRFAVYGSDRVAGAASSSELAATLNELFAPFTDGVQVYTAGEPRNPGPAHSGPPPGDWLFWQHIGVGLGHPGPYRSARVNRPDTGGGASGFGNVMRMIDATAYRGLEIRISAAVRADVSDGRGSGHVWLRVDRPDEVVAFFDNMDDRPISDSEWRRYSIDGTVADDAVAIAYGVFLQGEGRLWFDDVTLDVKRDGEWHSVRIDNPGFEETDSGWPGWFEFGNAYAFALAGDNANAGARSMSIRNDETYRPGQLFDAVPDTTAIDKPIGAGLRVRVPIALPDVRGDIAPYPFADDTSTPELPVDDPAVRHAGVIITWNLLQHFYPYFDVVDVDWDDALTSALFDAGDDTNRDDYRETLKRLLAAAEDGHGNVGDLQIRTPPGLPPFAVDWIDERVVVTRSTIPERVLPGDVVVSIDDRDAIESVDDFAALESGTLRWRRSRALDNFGYGDLGSSVPLVLDRDGSRIEFDVTLDRQAPVTPMRDPYEALGDREYYVDLTRIEWPDLQSRLDDLADADAIVFDLRGYPKGNHLILTHLYDEPVQSAYWLVPRILYPDQERITGWGDPPSRWFLAPGEPRISARVAFLTDASAISYAESVMGIVEYYRLGTIVGEATAGTNGNVNYTDLPGGFRVLFTGMRVIKHDGTPHHLVGIRPTVPVEPTIAGIRAGIDEVLEAALAELRREQN